MCILHIPQSDKHIPRSTHYTNSSIPMLESPAPSIPQRPKSRPKKSDDALTANLGNSSGAVPSIPQRPRKSDTLSSLETVESDRKEDVPVIPSRPRKQKEEAEPATVEHKMPHIPQRPKREKHEETRIENPKEPEVVSIGEPEESVSENADEEPVEPTESKVLGKATDLISKQSSEDVDDSHIVETPTLPLSGKVEKADDASIVEPELQEIETAAPEVPDHPKIDDADVPKEPESDLPVDPELPLGAESEAGGDLAESLGSKIRELREINSEATDSPSDVVKLESSEIGEVDEIDTAALRNEKIADVEESAPATDNLSSKILESEEEENAGPETKPHEAEKQTLDVQEAAESVEDVGLPVKSSKADDEDLKEAPKPATAKGPVVLEKPSKEEASLDDEVPVKDKESAEDEVAKSSVDKDEDSIKNAVKEDSLSSLKSEDDSKSEIPEDKSSPEETLSEAVAAKEEEPEPRMPIIPLRPSKPKKIDSTVSELDSKSSPSVPSRPPRPATKEKPKDPPPKPKKLSSKIAAFQQMFNQEPAETSKEEKSSPEKRGKLSSDKTNFAANLQNMMGAGIALPGMANPEMLKKLAPAESEQEPSKKKSENVPQSSSRRAKGPRGKRLPKSIQESTIAIEPRFKFSSGHLWEIDFNSEEKEQQEDVQDAESTKEVAAGESEAFDDEAPKDAEAKSTADAQEDSIPITKADESEQPESVNLPDSLDLTKSVDQPENVEELPRLQDTQREPDAEEELLKIESATSRPLGSLEKADFTLNEALKEAEPNYEIISKEKDHVETPRANTSGTEEFDDDSGFEEAREVFSSPKPLGDFTKLPDSEDDDPTVQAQEQLKELSAIVQKDKSQDEPVFVDKAGEA